MGVPVMIMDIPYSKPVTEVILLQEIHPVLGQAAMMHI